MKSQRAILGVLLLLAFLGSGLKVYSNSSTVVVNLSTPRLLWNNHVGGSWGYAAKFDEDGKEDEQDYLVFNEPIELVVRDEVLIIPVIAWENDKSADIGWNRFEIPIYELTVNEKEFTCTVQVFEDRGRYAGNSAGWEFKMTVKMDRDDNILH